MRIADRGFGAAARSIAPIWLLALGTENSDLVGLGFSARTQTPLPTAGRGEATADFPATATPGRLVLFSNSRPHLSRARAAAESDLLAVLVFKCQRTMRDQGREGGREAQL